PEDGKPLFSLAIALALGLASRSGKASAAWAYPAMAALAVVLYGAMLTFSPTIGEDLRLAYHFAYGVLALAMIALTGTRSVPAGDLILGFGHIQMLFGLYTLSKRVDMSGSLFVSLSWGLYALVVLGWGARQRDQRVGQSAVLIL